MKFKIIKRKKSTKRSSVYKFKHVIKNVFKVIAILFLLAIVITFSELTFAMKDGKRLDHESQDYVNAVVPQIFSHWNSKDFMKYADDSLRGASSEYDIKKFFDLSSKKLGKMTLYEGSQGQSITMINNFRKVITAKYIARVKFENYPAQVEVGLSSHSGKWYIQSFKIDSEAYAH